MTDTLDETRRRIREFAIARDWQQFHTPKNLVLALAGEVGELAALLQWLAPTEIDEWLTEPTNRESLRDEIADVLIYLLQLCDAVDVDPLHAIDTKIALNNRKYPVNLARGNARKYTELAP